MKHKAKDICYLSVCRMIQFLLGSEQYQPWSFTKRVRRRHFFIVNNMLRFFLNSALLILWWHCLSTFLTYYPNTEHIMSRRDVWKRGLFNQSSLCNEDSTEIELHKPCGWLMK